MSPEVEIYFGSWPMCLIRVEPIPPRLAPEPSLFVGWNSPARGMHMFQETLQHSLDVFSWNCSMNWVVSSPILLLLAIPTVTN